MIEVDGIILVLSCQKHMNTRLKHCKLPQNQYGKWEVIYVIGDLFLDSNYAINGNCMTIKCEDSYIHLLKKLVLALKYIYELFDIKQGVLRCGDDLLFNETLLVNFLDSEKEDFIGKTPLNQSLLASDITDELMKRTRDDFFMVNYYNLHPEDFDNPQHNLKGVDIQQYIKRPEIAIGAAGVLFYISNKCCKLLIDHLESINYDIFCYDDFTDSYPYTIEDCAVCYILYRNRISFIHNYSMFTEYNESDAIAIHTNMYKYN